MRRRSREMQVRGSSSMKRTHGTTDLNHPLQQQQCQQRKQRLLLPPSRSPSCLLRLHSAHFSFVATLLLLAALSFRSLLPTPAHVAAASAAEGAADEEKVVEDQFLQWLHRHGVREVLEPNRKLRMVSGGGRGERGLVACRRISKGETVLTVPFNVSLVLSPDDPLPFDDAGPTMGLVALLLREVSKGENSFWAPYLKIFPKKMDVPWLSLPPSLFSLFQFGPTVRRLHAIHDHLLDLHAACDASAIANADVTRFKWAMAVLYTRRFATVIPSKQTDGSQLHLFLPFGDLLNHRELFKGDDGDVNWHEGARDDRLELKALRDIEEGEEVFESYLAASTEQLALLQGFVPDFNSQHRAVIFESFEEAISWFVRKVDVRLEQDPWIFTPLLVVARNASERVMRKLEAGWDEDDHWGTGGFSGDSSLHTLEGAVAVGEGWEGVDRVGAAFVAMKMALDDEKKTAGKDIGEGKVREGVWEMVLKFVGALLMERCEEVLDGMETSLEEDLELQLQVERNGKLCVECTDEDHKRGLLIALKYRIAVKRILRKLTVKGPTLARVLTIT